MLKEKKERTIVHRKSDVIVFLIDALPFSIRSQVVTLLICLTSIVLQHDYDVHEESALSSANVSRQDWTVVAFIVEEFDSCFVNIDHFLSFQTEN